MLHFRTSDQDLQCLSEQLFLESGHYWFWKILDSSVCLKVLLYLKVNPVIHHCQEFQLANPLWFSINLSCWDTPVCIQIPVLNQKNDLISLFCIFMQRRLRWFSTHLQSCSSLGPRLENISCPQHSKNGGGAYSVVHQSIFPFRALTPEPYRIDSLTSPMGRSYQDKNDNCFLFLFLSNLPLAKMKLHKWVYHI